MNGHAMAWSMYVRRSADWKDDDPRFAWGWIMGYGNDSVLRWYTLRDLNAETPRMARKW